MNLNDGLNYTMLFCMLMSYSMAWFGLWAKNKYCYKTPNALLYEYGKRLYVKSICVYVFSSFIYGLTLIHAFEIIPRNI